MVLFVVSSSNRVLCLKTRRYEAFRFHLNSSRWSFIFFMKYILSRWRVWKSNIKKINFLALLLIFSRVVHTPKGLKLLLPSSPRTRLMHLCRTFLSTIKWKLFAKKITAIKTARNRRRPKKKNNNAPPRLSYVQLPVDGMRMRMILQVLKVEVFLSKWMKRMLPIWMNRREQT